jgi:prepilin-type N-terminal cleavage/methylation domain-containing protein
MVKIATSPATDRVRHPDLTHPQAGMTLFELLIALSMMAVIASFTVAVMTGGQETRRFEASIDLLISDLTDARLSAVAENQPRWVVPTETGYRLEAENLDRAWPDDVDARWQVQRGRRWRDIERVEVSPARTPFLHLRVTLTRGDERRLIFVDPVSGRVRNG